MRALLAFMIFVAVVAYGSTEIAKQFDTSDIASARRAREHLIDHAGE
nr:hypothetical protein [Marinobacterium profundum]